MPGAVRTGSTVTQRLRVSALWPEPLWNPAQDWPKRPLPRASFPRARRC